MLSRRITKESELTSANVKELIQHSSDITFRELYINGNKDLPVTMVFVDGVINTKTVNDDILKPLAQEMYLSQSDKAEDIIDRIEHGTLYHASQKTTDKLMDCIGDIIDGSVALIFDQVRKAVTFDIKGFEKRSITEPTAENVIKGGKDSFIEDLRTNTAIVRRKLKTHNLVIEETKVGKQSLTNVAIIYINGITNRHIVGELKKRLDKINVDGVLSPGVIEENIVDNKYSPFPQVIYTERPDKFCSNVMEGRVGVIIDGLPVTYIVPGTFESFMQTPEDYAQNFIVSSIIRFLRFLLTFVTLFCRGFMFQLRHSIMK